MAGHDLIVIGGSAGSIPALLELVSGLPADLLAAVCIVVHLSPLSTSQLPVLLSRKAALPAAYAVEGETIQPGRIYVAQPDYHLVIKDGKLMLDHGPRENRVRPAIDPLFRSAARYYGKRAVGVVLSGNLGDGSTGLMVLKAYGATTLVQNPEEALFNSMPRKALELAEVDYVLPVAQMAPLLVQLAWESPVQTQTETEKGLEKGEPSPMAYEMEELSPIIQQDLAEQAQDQRNGQTAVVVCPDCGGVLWQLNQGRLVQFQCHTGHKWSPEVLLVQKTEELENALWSCVRMLTEKAILTRQTAARLREAGDEDRARRVEEQAELDQRHIHLIRDLILQTNDNPMSQTFRVEEIVGEDQPDP
jgi:two-component system chemotaxis response regulator CheB